MASEQSFEIFWKLIHEKIDLSDEQKQLIHETMEKVGMIDTTNHEMYAVIEYFNYRKDVEIKILHITRTFEQADHIAHQIAILEYGEDAVVDEVDDSYLNIGNNVYKEYTKGDGYEQNVYGVMELPPILEEHAIVIPEYEQELKQRNMFLSHFAQLTTSK